MTWREGTQWAGDKYEGEYKHDKRHGQGVYNYANGNTYDGQWYEGV